VHLLTLSARLEIGPTDILDPGVYIAPDIVSAQLLLMANGGSMSPLVTENVPLGQRSLERMGLEWLAF
jgi:hypothetical protein